MNRSFFLSSAISATCFSFLAGCALAVPATSSSSSNALHWQPLMEPGSGGAITDVSVSPFDSKRVLVAGDMLGVGVSANQGESWGPATGFSTWEMASFTWHPTNPNEVWVGSMSGPYCSLDGGKTWVSKRAGMPAPAGFGYSVPIEKVIFDPHDAKHLIAIGGSSRHWESIGTPAWGAVWNSVDGGENWTRLSTVTADGSSSDAGAKGVNITWAAFAPGSSQNLFAQADEAGFLASTDGGRTWTKRNEGLPLTDHRIAQHPTNANILWASVDNTLPDGATQRVPGGIWKTTDGGAHWEKASDGLGQVITGQDYNLTSHYRAIAVAPSNPNVLYTNDTAWTTGTTYKSEDGGAHWRMLVSKQNIGINNEDPEKRRVFQLETATPAGMGLAGISVDPRDANASYGFNTEYIPRSLDGGATWNDATSQKVADAWLGRGYSGWVTVGFRFDPYKSGESVFQGMDASRAWVSTDDLGSWRRVEAGPDAWNGGRDTSFTKAGTIFSTFGTYNFTGIGRSNDGGKTWTVLAGADHGLPDFYKGAAPGGIYSLPDGSKVWAVVDGKLLQSTDNGEQWTSVLDRPGLQWMAADPKKPTRFFVAGERNIYLSEDGQNFSPIGGPHTRDSRMTVDSKGRLLVAASGSALSGLWRCDLSNIAAPKWTRLSDEGAIGGVAVDPTDSNRIVYSTNQNPFTEVSAASGVYCSSDGGRSWSQQNAGLSMLRGNVVAIDPFHPSRLVFGSYGRGFFQTNWPKTLAFKGARSYVSTVADTGFAGVQDETQFPIRDFGPTGVDYTYGQDWKNGVNVTTGSENGTGFLQIVSTEFGGAGVVLNGANIVPKGQTHLAMRVRLLEGNQATTLAVHLNPKTGDGHNYEFDLSKANEETFTTLTLPLGAGDFSAIQQVQLQGVNFGGGAKPLRIEIDSLVTLTPTGAGGAPPAAKAPATPIAAAPAKAPIAGGAGAISYQVRDFGAQGLDYTYGQDWKNGVNVSQAKDGGVAVLKIDSTEFGGGGIVLNGQNIAPTGQTLLVLRAKLLDGNGAGKISVHILPKTGDAHNYDFDLSKLNAQGFTTLTLPLGDGKFDNVQQIQLQGSNFGAGAAPLKIEIAALGTT